ncbi:unnamed protein product [Parascedosporium putredinis]|uniref:gamma-glutamylcyclotransferase n=1 Tax=Parascedosporium putredinis TaxID=1442378 RepID=A0A9P1MAD0_9PEZI|nr:unnamed protein product [Parascedosporium putredinis]CAI7997438.1 unnamed protein product [Parascedosporium putredinis]
MASEAKAEAEHVLLPVPDMTADGTAAGGPDTILYLAFGSNLCAETFLGRRKISPLSQLNVTCPSLRLTFSIPGLPYMEPCFANTAVREIPKEPALPDPRNPAPVIPPPVDDPEDAPPRWEKGLVGVVYEVTKEDYAKIIATEGGGSGYQEIVRTQYSDSEDNSGGGDDDNDDDDGGNKGWWWRFIRRGRQRPDPDYAQPSERYLNLLRTGAAEHELPDEYQAYLAALRPFTTTTWRQKVGKAVMGLMWGPLLMTTFGLGSLIADDKGKVPTWYAGCMTGTFSCIWVSYDWILKPLFGDGERTMEKKGEKKVAWWSEVPVGRVTGILGVACRNIEPQISSALQRSLRVRLPNQV